MAQDGCQTPLEYSIVLLDPPLGIPQWGGKIVASQLWTNLEYLYYVLVPGSNASTTVQNWNIMQMRQNIYYFAWSRLTNGFYNLHSSRLAWKTKYNSWKHSILMSLIFNHAPTARHLGCRLEILNETSLVICSICNLEYAATSGQYNLMYWQVTLWWI